MTYASNTTVSVEKSRAEIEATLRRYGADQFLSGWDDQGKAVIGFRAAGRHVNFVLMMPDKNADEFRFSRHKDKCNRKRRTDTQAIAHWEQSCRQRWRALCLVIKAKLEAVEAGITCFEDEFLAHIVMPDGKSVSQWLRPQLAIAYETGAMPRSLIGLPDNRGEE